MAGIIGVLVKENGKPLNEWQHYCVLPGHCCEVVLSYSPYGDLKSAQMHPLRNA